MSGVAGDPLLEEAGVTIKGRLDPCDALRMPTEEGRSPSCWLGGSSMTEVEMDGARTLKDFHHTACRGSTWTFISQTSPKAPLSCKEGKQHLMCLTGCCICV